MYRFESTVWQNLHSSIWTLIITPGLGDYLEYLGSNLGELTLLRTNGPMQSQWFIRGKPISPSQAFESSYYMSTLDSKSLTMPIAAVFCLVRYKFIPLPRIGLHTLFHTKSWIFLWCTTTYLKIAFKLTSSELLKIFFSRHTWFLVFTLTLCLQ